MSPRSSLGWVQTIYPKQFILQENGMTAAKDNTAFFGAYDVVKSYSGKIVIGYQLVTSAMLHPSGLEPKFCNI